MLTTRRVLFLLTLALLALSAVGGARAESAGTLRVGTYLDNKPWQFRDVDGRIVGFEVDMVDYIASHLGVRVEVAQMPFRELFGALEQNHIDIAMSSISVTSERRARFDFTQPYFDTTQAVVVLKTSRIRNLAGLAGKTVSVIPGTTSDLWVEVNKGRYRIGRVVPAVGLDEGLDNISSGKADAHIGDLPALLYRLLKRTDLAVVTRLPTDERYALMLSKGSPLTAKVDGLVSQMKQDGTLARIHEKWFGIPPESTSSVVRVTPRP